MAPQALIDRPVINDRIAPYYKGWNILDPRRQFNESGAQAIPLTDIRCAAEIIVGDDPDDVYEFAAVMSTVEAMVLKEYADKRKRDIEAAKRKSKAR